ncbi:hypothetical protein GCM10009535_12560 [Streptomyces thermocarboxydovorans]|uniref:Uncharacterized protein n=1 Tax=Streptomyces thermocarboxydovorans TaxID=59298 RepID=A0ABP3SG85_9ACTN
MALDAAFLGCGLESAAQCPGGHVGGIGERRLVQRHHTVRVLDDGDLLGAGDDLVGLGADVGLAVEVGDRAVAEADGPLGLAEFLAGHAEVDLCLVELFGELVAFGGELVVGGRQAADLLDAGVDGFLQFADALLGAAVVVLEPVLALLAPAFQVVGEAHGHSRSRSM